ncbi:hypothetical protein T310_9487 [Rasamsonia emersonii CBS 393.64]|uniref:Nucleoporin Nup120/160-domain-containing protein n=1 Tax=Rasamsonia emersonii (strain ATCC 16479 / CBS 393.64 / IMI 116815) TaxID=1408163 RepID=A0A0F4YGW3_RASE3|nr:hypothetical protein T310_9487 [Rasamsonia emersonii CBS 393.64]KKA16873.1 hypothetical protein T310_9487 [Rasamsonia emersonii CBS 393.64]
MAKIYKETKVDVRPIAPNAVVDIQIPTQENAQRRARFSISSVTAQDIPSIKDEDDFARRFLATQGSLYFRRRKVYPRTFLWRVVDDNKVLEIQSADLVRGGIEHHEVNLMLRFDFQEAILPSGVALADTEEHEVLNVFVLTASRRLHTLALRPEFFRRASAIDENILDWCKACTPSPLTFSHPHRLHASSTTELFISLDSGALLRLTRRAGDDGTVSSVTIHKSGWGASLRGLMKWGTQPTIRYNGRSLDQNTPNAIATTSDQTYVFAVCLNHTLKVWNLATNKLVGSKDLLDRQVQQQDSAAYFLNPSDSAFIRVFNAERALDGGYRYYILTYSPHEDGRFKFWAVKGGLTTQLTIEDLFPQAVLRPFDPDPSGNMFWSVADFQVRPMEEGKRMELWVLWRNNNLYQLYSLHFDFQSLVEDWSNNWTSIALDTRRNDPPPALVVSDNVDPTEKWLKYFFHPGRYSPEALEAALVTYQEALKPRSSPSILKKSAPLQERLCSTIAATVSLRKYSETDLDYARYRTDTDAKWRQFWQIAEDINNRRFEPISLAYDSYSDLPWVLLTDSCVLVRECSAMELLLHNSASVLRDEAAKIGDRWRHRNLETELGDRYDQASYLIEVAAGFRKRLPAEVHRSCQSAIEAEIFMEPSLSAPDRLAAFQERSELGERVSDDIFDSLCAAMNERLNIYKLPSELFYAIIDTIPLGFPGKDSDLLLTAFGLRATVNGSQETISDTCQILYDLLILVVFIAGEINQEDGSTFDAVDLFSTLIEVIKEYKMLYWLSSTTRVSPNRAQNDAGDSSVSTFSLKPQTKGTGVVSTILEDLFAVHIKPRPAVGVPQSYTLTQGIRDVLSWVTRQGEVAFPNVLVFIQCDLIANGNIDLACDFLRFQPNTAWATYAKGRLYVAKSEFDTAALYFQKAAHLLSSGRALGNLHEMSSSLLDILSVDSFNNGLPKYFQHVISVFEQARSFSHVADFASLALQALERDNQKAEHDPEYADLRSDLLSRLFHASLKTCQFDKAYSALSRYTNLTLQKSALSSLITSIFSAYGGSAGLEQLLRFPLLLNPTLSSYVDEILLSLAKKQTSFRSALEPDDRLWEGNNSTPDYHRILYAYRIARNDFRGAAELGYQTVQRLRNARDAPSSQLTLAKRIRDEGDTNRLVEEDDMESKEIRHELLSLINLLACVDKNEAYILVELDGPSPAAPTLTASEAGSPGKRQDGDDVFMEDATPSKNPPAATNGSLLSFFGGSRRASSGSSVAGASNTGPQQSTTTTNNHNNTNTKQQPRRVVVTLDHLRREYQAELDRVSRIERGDWEFGAVEGSEDQDMDDTLLANI